MGDVVGVVGVVGGVVLVLLFVSGSRFNVSALS
jgi:hypothetical protein